MGIRLSSFVRARQEIGATVALTVAPFLLGQHQHGAPAASPAKATGHAHHGSAAVTYTFTPSGSFGRTATETSNLDRIYGKDPIGFWIFLRLRPAAMTH